MAEIPRYSEIRQDLERQIISGKWPPGHLLPSEHDLARHYDVARMTVNKALTELAASGLVVRKRRRGTVVAQPRSQNMALSISDIRDEVTALGGEYRYRLLSRKIRNLSAREKTIPALAKHDRVVDLEAVHYSDEIPFVFEKRLINLDIVEDAAEADFQRESGGSWLIRRIPWTRAELVIRSMQADRKLASRLGVQIGDALLVVARRTWHQKDMVTSVHLHYPGTRHELTATFTPGVDSVNA